MPRKLLIAGNWKMNGLEAALGELNAIAAGTPAGPDLMIFPPATLIHRASGLGIIIGGQDCHAASGGAHTGDISAAMLADAGAEAVILGHSERRADHGETDETVAAKVAAAWDAGLTAIICVGETELERDAGTALAIVAAQIEGSVPSGATANNTVIAYEPVWAIGSGRTPTLEDIAEIHDAVRAQLVDRFDEEGERMRILYGGSMKPENAAGILAIQNVDGGLVGGASLHATDFLAIARAASQAAR
jgi:triosephosphate isomerase